MIDVRTFRAESMQEALARVRRELGPEAVILHTRELGRGLFSRLARRQRRIEVTAGVGMKVRSGPIRRSAGEPLPASGSIHRSEDRFDHQLRCLTGMMEEIVRRSRYHHVTQLPDAFLARYADLVEAEVTEEIARELVYRLHEQWPGSTAAEPALLQARLAPMIAAEFAVQGPIVCRPGQRRVVALVGPTGVGKTTTIAKLAANFRLRHGQRVGLVTVDTYRIAAVEHLRAYAEIIDLPMKVVMGPRDMQRALAELSEPDLVLIDTAGRSPREELKIQQLKAMLQEAAADEVHLVLSAGSNRRSLIAAADTFAPVGVTALLLTKVDEAASMGGLLALARQSRLPMSYLTTGQNVPEDIEPADALRLARLLLAQESLRP